MKRQAELSEENAQLEAQIQSVKVEREAQLQVIVLGGDPRRLEAILTLRETTPYDVLEDGEPNPEAIRSTIQAVFNRIPELRRAGWEPGNESSSLDPRPRNGLVAGIKCVKNALSFVPSVSEKSPKRQFVYSLGPLPRGLYL